MIARILCIQQNDAQAHTVTQSGSGDKMDASANVASVVHTRVQRRVDTVHYFITHWGRDCSSPSQRFPEGTPRREQHTPRADTHMKALCTQERIHTIRSIETDPCAGTEVVISNCEILSTSFCTQMSSVPLFLNDTCRGISMKGLFLHSYPF